MRAVTLDPDVEKIGAGHRRSRKDRDFAEVEVWRIMQAVDFVAGEFVEQAVLDHRPRAAKTFLGGLEDEVHGAVEIAGFREVARGAEQHGGMAVMAAAVKTAGNGRTPGQVGIFLHRQRVHVGAQPDPLAAGALALEHADHAGDAEPAMHLDAPLRQFFRDDAGGADLLEADLGVRMEIPADRGEFVGIAFDAFNAGHVCYPVAEGRTRT